MTSPGDGGEPPGSQSPWALLGLGSELAATLLFGVVLGYFVDRWFQTAPWGLISGATLGIVAALVNFFRKAIPPKEPR
jgi:F0F1-type ATP synthase assembly protein I